MLAEAIATGGSISWVSKGRMLSISDFEGGADASTLFCTGSGVLADAIRTGGSTSRGSGKAASTISVSGTETPSTLSLAIAVARGVSTAIARSAVFDAGRTEAS